MGSATFAYRVKWLSRIAVDGRADLPRLGRLGRRRQAGSRGGGAGSERADLAGAAGFDVLVVDPHQGDHVGVIGVVGDPTRQGSGQRRYPRPALRRIAFIVFAQRVGLSLEEIAAELERLKAGLTECIGCGCLSLDRCKLSNPDDRAARLGSGPRYWLGDRPVATAKG
jgi:MerR family transcriptional regulator, redox-sensitive transcriptional activator SoxR